MSIKQKRSSHINTSGKAFSIAEFREYDEETLVHNQIIPEGYSTWHEIIHAKFLLISIFAASALNWD